MRISALALAAFELYRLALPGYHYEFPRDHFNHPEFKTEWWYYTGNLHDAAGRRFGFELTFFRQGVARDAQPAAVWDVKDIWLAHLALSDIDGNRFLHAERLNRSGPGIAGADLAQARVWNGNWQSLWDLKAGTQKLQAVDPRFSFDLTLKPAKPPVIHGVDGVSQKSSARGRASHYVSFTRLATVGAITLEGRTFTVDGLTWMDHEFFTSQLENDQAGWDWFSLQLDDNTELMLFRLRHKDGTIDPFSAGTYVDAQGHSTHVTNFTATPGKQWNGYPIEWNIRVPSLGIDVNATTRLPQQELKTRQNSYWEGAIEINGSRRGAGYLEMTGYTAPVNMGG